MNIANKVRGKRNQKVGVWGEQAAERALMSLGFHCIERIETGWYIRWVNGKVVSAKPRAKVSGDFHCIGPDGQYCHVEVKVRGKDVLVHSDLEPHQVEAMDEKTKWNALCLLIWIRSPTELKVLRWPIPGFKKGTSLLWSDIK